VELQLEKKLVASVILIVNFSVIKYFSFASVVAIGIFFCSGK
jgi:hypothetical protein